MAKKIRDILELLKDDGWKEIKGRRTSHMQFKHHTKKGKVTLPFHGKSKNISEGTYISILKQASITRKRCEK